MQGGEPPEGVPSSGSSCFTTPRPKVARGHLLRFGGRLPQGGDEILSAMPKPATPRVQRTSVTKYNVAAFAYVEAEQARSAACGGGGGRPPLSGGPPVPGMAARLFGSVARLCASAGIGSRRMHDALGLQLVCDEPGQGPTRSQRPSPNEGFRSASCRRTRRKPRPTRREPAGRPHRAAAACWPRRRSSWTSARSLKHAPRADSKVDRPRDGGRKRLARHDDDRAKRGRGAIFAGEAWARSLFHSF